MLKEQGDFGTWKWGILGLVSMGTTAILVSGTISYQVAAVSEGAFYEMARGITLLGGSEHSEHFLLTAITMSRFCTETFLLTCMMKVARENIEMNSKAIIWVAAIIPIVFSMIQELEFLTDVWGIAILYVLPIIKYFTVKTICREK